MKALAVFPSSREVRLIDQPEPMIAGPTEVKLRTLEAGICGAVNAGRASFEEGVRDLSSFMRRLPAAVRALITGRVALDDARDAVLAKGGIKSVITVA